MIKVAIDAMGGDNAPGAVLEACVSATAAFPELHIILCGPATDLRHKLLAFKLDARLCDIDSLPDMDGDDDESRVCVVEAPEIIGNNEHPVVAVRRKSKSSLVTAIDLVKAKKAHACVSAGSTGALLAGGILRIGCIEGITRPALAPLLPTRNAPVMLIDAGANVDCKPEYLVQFGLMGSIYMERVMERPNPRIALINIGQEAEKGNDAVKKAYALMQKQSYNFIGNVEARDIPLGEVDVLVADGFSGNIVLKLIEGMGLTMFSMLKEDVASGGPLSRLGGALLRPALRRFKQRMDPDETGGAVMLGVNGGIIKAHGSSSARALHQSLAAALKMVKSDVVPLISTGLSTLKLL